MRREVTARFIHYAMMMTQSDPNSSSVPTTDTQLLFARQLAGELQSLGLTEVDLDENGYLMATLPATKGLEHLPAVGFIAHMDTSPDFSGDRVRPSIIPVYDGGDILLNKDLNIVLSPSQFPDLLKYRGEELIVTDGTTLLGADDKAGVAEIVTAMEYLIAHPEIAHGRIRIGFTPDEEVGRGADHFDVVKFGASFAYTFDGGERGELEYENFNAAAAAVTFHGVSVHPGYAKDRMIHAIHLATDFISQLPAGQRAGTTEGREGFFHITSLKGGVEEALLELIIRDFDQDSFDARKVLLEKMTSDMNHAYGRQVVSLSIKEQYANMIKKIEPFYGIVTLARDAMTDCGIEPRVIPIRGGTDGARLSFMGLPCPNIFAGGHNFHGRYEFIPTQSMEQACRLLIRIVEKIVENPSLIPDNKVV